MKVLQTHVLVCVHVILGNGLIRLKIHRHWKMENSKENTVIKCKNTTINKEFTLFSKATSLVQLSVVAFFYCVFKVEVYNEELNLSLLK